MSVSAGRGSAEGDRVSRRAVRCRSSSTSCGGSGRGSVLRRRRSVAASAFGRLPLSGLLTGQDHAGPRVRGRTITARSTGRSASFDKGERSPGSISDLQLSLVDRDQTAGAGGRWCWRQMALRWILDFPAVTTVIRRPPIADRERARRIAPLRHPRTARRALSARRPAARPPALVTGARSPSRAPRGDCRDAGGTSGTNACSSITMGGPDRAAVALEAAITNWSRARRSSPCATRRRRDRAAGR